MKIRESIKKGLSVATGSMGLVLILFIFGAVWNLINVSLTPRLENPDAGTTAIIVGVGILFILAVRVSSWTKITSVYTSKPSIS